MSAADIRYADIIERLESINLSPGARDLADALLAELAGRLDPAIVAAYHGVIMRFPGQWQDARDSHGRQ